VTPDAPSQQSQAGDAIYCPEVWVARSFQHAARQLGTVRSDDQYPAPQLEPSHYMVDGRKPAISSTPSGARCP